MTFNFAKAIEEAADLTNKGLLQALVLGQQGAGKSRAIGTLPGKVLYLYSLGETHGPISAGSVPGSEVVPLCLDIEDGKPLSADDSFKRLLSILTSVDGLKQGGIKSIVIDSATELEAIIRDSTQFKRACATKDGGHNSFAEGGATIAMLRQVMMALENAQRAIGCHYVITCALDVKDRGVDGEILEASPRMQGFNVAADFVRMFHEVLVVGEIERGGVIKRKFQFGADITKVSKDLKTGTVKKMLNLKPCIRGVDDVPPLVDADLKEVIKLKKGNK